MQFILIFVNMKDEYNVILWDFNRKEVEYYDIIPYFKECWNDLKKKPKSFYDIKQFIISESRYQFWSRCEYEIVITGFPENSRTQKIDVFDQIMSNIDIVTEVFINSLAK